MSVDMTAISLATIISGTIAGITLKIVSNRLPKWADQKIKELEYLHAKPLSECEKDKKRVDLNIDRLISHEEKINDSLNVFIRESMVSDDYFKTIVEQHGCAIPKLQYRLEHLESKIFSSMNKISLDIGEIKGKLKINRRTNGND